MTAVGIDFGTTNSLVAHLRDGRPEALPLDDNVPADWAAEGFDRVMASVMGIGHEGTLVFGWQAKMEPGEKVEAVKRALGGQDVIQIGDNTLLVEELTTAFFAKLKQQTARRGGIEFDQAVVTVPANSIGLARYRTRICAGMAGIQVLALLNEPTAAAMAFGRSLTEDQTLLVVDWGGGTLDVTVLEVLEGVFVEKASKGVHALGGKDFDSAFAAELAKRVAEADSWTAAERDDFRRNVEWAKIRLSSEDKAQVLLPTGESREVTRSDFEAMTSRLTERVGPPIRKCLGDLGMEGGDIDSLLLVGGTCKVPAVRRFVEDVVGRPAVTGVDPMTAIAEGAALAAGILTNQITDTDFFVSTEHALGCIVLGQDKLKFSPIIPRNHALPVEKSDVYTPVRDFQDAVTVQVIEGDPDEPLDSESNVLLREWSIPIEPPRPVAEAPFEVKFRYDIDGILHVDVTDITTNKVVSQDQVIFEAARDPADLVEISRAAQELVAGERQVESTSPVRAEQRAGHSAKDQDLLGKARNKVMPFLESADQERLRALCDKVESGDGDAVEDLETFLRSYSYLF